MSETTVNNYTKVRCVHTDKRGLPCIGNHAFIYKGEVSICPSSEINEHTEVLQKARLIIELKCNSCKKKSFLVMD